MRQEELLQALRENSSAEAHLVFGEAVAQGDRTVVPMARVLQGFGWGVGSGSQQGSGQGEGGGRGGFIRARPVAVLEIGPDGTRIRPVPDVTRLAFGGMLLMAWNVYWLTRMVRALWGREPSPSR